MKYLFGIWHVSRNPWGKLYNNSSLDFRVIFCCTSFSHHVHHRFHWGNQIICKINVNFLRLNWPLKWENVKKIRKNIHEFEFYFCCCCLFNLEQIFSGCWNKSRQHWEKERERTIWKQKKTENGTLTMFRFVSLLFLFFVCVANIDVGPDATKMWRMFNFSLRFLTQNSFRNLIFFINIREMNSN